MFYYKLNEDDTIQQFTEIPSGEIVDSYFSDWLQTENKIIILHNGNFAFEKDVDMKAEAQAIEKQNTINGYNQAIEMLKQELSSTDYVAIKIAEGVASREEYADVLAQRVQARQRINELQELIASLSI